MSAGILTAVTLFSKYGNLTVADLTPDITSEFAKAFGYELDPEACQAIVSLAQTGAMDQNLLQWGQKVMSTGIMKLIPQKASAEGECYVRCPHCEAPFILNKDSFK